MAHTADIVEIFSSPQGEGPYAGERMTFVRFARCSLGCCFCDTPQGLCDRAHFRVESPAGSTKFVEEKNPVTATALCELLAGFDDKTISITGGEPLEQADFLEEWLPSISHSRRILLETNGIHAQALERVLPHVHVVSMDIKLPSSAGLTPRWQEQGAFLAAAIESGRETYVKLVVTAETTDRDIQDAISLVARANKYIQVVIQPASRTLAFHAPADAKRIESVERLCSAWLPNVRVIPQMHKVWNVL